MEKSLFKVRHNLKTIYNYFFLFESEIPKRSSQQTDNMNPEGTATVGETFATQLIGLFPYQT